MKGKQAAALLQDNQRYLYHICIRGMKGSNYKRVTQWYQLITEHAESLASLLDEELSNQVFLKPSRPPNATGVNQIPQTKNVFRTLNILKAGFYSHNEDVVQSCITLFQTIVTEFNKIGGDILGQLWEWFTQTTAFKKPDYKFGIRYSIDTRL